MSLRKLTPEESEYRHHLLDSFFAKGFHPRLLSHLQGRTADDEWETLEYIVMSDPSEIDWEGVMRGTGWRSFVPR